MRRPARAVGLILFVAPSFLAALFLAVSGRLSRPLHRRAQPRLMRAWFRVLARMLGLRIRSTGEPQPGPALLACNHFSWLDIVVIGATLEAAAFVSKGEIDRWPVLGYIARHGGRTLFITRGELRSFQNLGGALIERLHGGERVVFFPEGTVSAGHGLLRFKPRLFEAACITGCRVQPVALAYTAGDGAPLAPMREGETFVGHMLRMLGARRTEAMLTFLPPLDSHAGDARMLASETRRRVTEALGHHANPDRVRYTTD